MKAVAPADASAEPDVPERAAPVLPGPGQIADTRSRGEAAAYRQALQNVRAAIHSIIAASDSDLRDRRFLLDCVRQVGIIYQDWDGLAPFTGYVNPVDYGLIQIPTEFVDYLMLTGASRPTTAIEIGVFRGVSTYVAAAYFYRLNKHHSYTAVDICDHLVDFDYFKDILPIIKAAPATSGHYAGRGFDLAFIDGDHSYDGSRKDWLNVGRSSGIVGFHDINGAEYDDQNGGIRRLWKELKLEYRFTCPVLEISHHPHWMGIGVIFNTPPPWLCNPDGGPRTG